MTSQHVTDLTVEQLQKLIRETVQQAMTEVMIEFAAAAEMDAKLAYEAELNDYLRASLQGKAMSLPDGINAWDLDD